MYKENQELKNTVKKIATWRLFICSDKWIRIFKSLSVVYFLAQTSIYALGTSEIWASKVVYYMCRVNPFGALFKNIPYSCFYSGSMCELERGTESIKGQEFHVHPSVILFLVGGIVTLHLAVVCLDRLESALGVDFLSRAIDKFLPGPKPPAPPANPPTPPPAL